MRRIVAADDAARGYCADRPGGLARVHSGDAAPGAVRRALWFSEWQIGLLFSAYPVCQLVAGPILGRLSDRYGRRPLLIFSQAGTALSFLILGLSRDFTVMLLARLLDGASGGNILVAQAYVADVTAARGSRAGHGIDRHGVRSGFRARAAARRLAAWACRSADDWRLRLPFLVAAGFSTLAWVLVSDPASRVAAARQAARARRRAYLSWRGIVDTIALPGVGLLVLIGFLAVLAFAAFEGHLRSFSVRRMHWDAQNRGIRLRRARVLERDRAGGLDPPAGPALWRGEADRGRADAGRLRIRRHGDWSEMPPSWLVRWCSWASARDCSVRRVSGLLSRITPMTEQGAVFGTLTSAQTLARMISYSAANFLLGKVSTRAPYWGAFGVDLVAWRPWRHGLAETHSRADDRHALEQWASIESSTLYLPVSSDRIGRSRSR